MKPYVVSPDAADELTSIWLYLEHEYGEEFADKTMRRLVHAFADLAETPGMGRIATKRPSLWITLSRGSRLDKRHIPHRMMEIDPKKYLAYLPFSTSYNGISESIKKSDAQKASGFCFLCEPSFNLRALCVHPSPLFLLCGVP